VTAPSADRARHAEAIEAPRVDDRAFRQGWRVTTRLDALLASGRIGVGVWQCAVEYRDAWERVLASGGGGGGSRVSGAADPHRRPLSVLTTTARINLAERLLGRERAALCFLCAVEDLSWAAIARSRRVHPETIRDRAVDALQALALVWPEAVAAFRTHDRTPPDLRAVQGASEAPHGIGGNRDRIGNGRDD
jgi:hypothetical protein